MSSNKRSVKNSPVYCDDDFHYDDEAPRQQPQILTDKSKEYNIERDGCDTLELPDSNENPPNSAFQLIVEKILGRKFVKNEDSQIEELYFIKWRGLSYLHVSWERRVDIERVDPQGKIKIKRFLQTNLSPEILGIEKNSDENTDEDNGDDVEYFQQDLAEVHRIISCDTLSVSHAKMSLQEIEDIAGSEEEDHEIGVKYLVKWRALPYNECSWETWEDLKPYFIEVWKFWNRQIPSPLKSSRSGLGSGSGSGGIYQGNCPNLQDYKRLEESPKFFTATTTTTSNDSTTNNNDHNNNTTNDNNTTSINNDHNNNTTAINNDVTLFALTLRDYQLEGLNWLLWNWWQRRSCILADEMGLGKTIQSIAFLHQLHEMSSTQLPGPFLIIAPLSLINQWSNELSTWSPKFNCIIFHGNNAAREMILKYEFYYQEPYNTKTIATTLKKSQIFKFDIMLTTYEVVLKDIRLLNRIQWQILIIDEAHRLKNPQTRIFEDLSSLHFDHCVLLTGTPLQNKTEELWALLHFADKVKFSDPVEFISRFGDLKDAAHVGELHSVLKPYLLRRVKEDVEKSLPPKEETIIEVSLTPLQKQIYRAIYERNTTYLFKGIKAGNQPSLMNVMMELRKCCNHPYLIRGVEDRLLSEISHESNAIEMSYKKMIDCSGKLVLLDKLLPKLYEEGHKVLIFSQMVRVLHILEDFLRYKGYDFERLDGNMRANDRNVSVERFCNPLMKRFVMLLSTKAGGLGLNLTVADTVIIFDSDWNPQNDIQAQARAHRIGQTRAVMVYRLLTSKTYEMHMFHKASLKLGLDRAVLVHARGEQEQENDVAAAAAAAIVLDNDNDNNNASKVAATTSSSSVSANALATTSGRLALQVKEIEELLKRGAYDIFRDKDNDDREQTEFVEADIESIMSRRAHKVSYSNINSDALSSSLGGFSKASFVSADQSEEVDINDPDFWKKVVGLNESSSTSTSTSSNVIGFNDGDCDILTSTSPDGTTSTSTPLQRKRKATQLYGMEENNRSNNNINNVHVDNDKYNDNNTNNDDEVDINDQFVMDNNSTTSKDNQLMKKSSNQSQSNMKMKIIKESKESKSIGIFVRDRLIKAFYSYGTRRWEKIRKESSMQKLSGEEISLFLNGFILQCGLSIDITDPTDSIYIKKCVHNSEQMSQQLKIDLKSIDSLIHPILQEEKFISKLKLGYAQKFLIRLDLLNNLLNMIRKAIETITPLETLTLQVEGQVQGQGQQPSLHTLPVPTVDVDVDLDEELSKLTIEDITNRFSLPTHRPVWMSSSESHSRNWWDITCDTHLLLGSFIHGYGNFIEILADSRLCFQSKLEAWNAKLATASSPMLAETDYIEVGDVNVSAVEFDVEDIKTTHSDVEVEGNLILSDGSTCRISISNRRESEYRGVYSQPGSLRWIAQYGTITSSVYIGTFDTEVEAAHAYDKTVVSMQGDNAICNFTLFGNRNILTARPLHASERPLLHFNRESKYHGVRPSESMMWIAEGYSEEGEQVDEDSNRTMMMRKKEIHEEQKERKKIHLGMFNTEIEAAIRSDEYKCKQHKQSRSNHNQSHNHNQERHISVAMDTTTSHSSILPLDLNLNFPLGIEHEIERIIDGMKISPPHTTTTTTTNGVSFKFFDVNGELTRTVESSSPSIPPSPSLAVEYKCNQELGQEQHQKQGQRQGTTLRDDIKRKILRDRNIATTAATTSTTLSQSQKDRTIPDPTPPTTTAPVVSSTMPDVRFLNRLLTFLLTSDDKVDTSITTTIATTIVEPSTTSETTSTTTTTTNKKKGQNKIKNQTNENIQKQPAKKREKSFFVTKEMKARWSLVGKRQQNMIHRRGRVLLSLLHQIFDPNAIILAENKERSLENDTKQQQGGGNVAMKTDNSSVHLSTTTITTTTPYVDDVDIRDLPEETLRRIISGLFMFAAPLAIPSNNNNNNNTNTSLSSTSSTSTSSQHLLPEEEESSIFTACSLSSPSATSSETLSSTSSSYYSWNHFIEYTSLDISCATAKDFYDKIWIPFCFDISQSDTIFNMHKRVFPNPYKPVTEHHLGSRGICHMFLYRQSMLCTIRYVLTYKLEKLNNYLRTQKFKDLNQFPVWWCPWIHDIGIITGIDRYGFMMLENIIKDENLPFSLPKLRGFIRRVFLEEDVPGRHFPPYNVFSTVEDAELWIEQVSLLFPDVDTLTTHISKILCDVTRDDLPVQHPCHFRTLHELGVKDMRILQPSLSVKRKRGPKPANTTTTTTHVSLSIAVEDYSSPGIPLPQFLEETRAIHMSPKQAKKISSR
eukprot:gene7276-14834_t